MLQFEIPTLEENHIAFPHPDTAWFNGILCSGGDLSKERLLLAYTYGIFPWYSPSEPILWWHPDPRFVIFPENIKIAKSMRSYFNKEKYHVTIDTCFEEVMLRCKYVNNREAEGTWISEEFLNSYTALHRDGIAHSVEVWDGDDLCGGLYGVSLGNVFYGESMFSEKSNASKFALITLAKLLQQRGFSLIDCQMPTAHLQSLGGEFITRKVFLGYLGESMRQETLSGSWSDMTDNISYREIIRR